jgi:hypothetical protein
MHRSIKGDLKRLTKSPVGAAYWRLGEANNVVYVISRIGEQRLLKISSSLP